MTYRQSRRRFEKPTYGENIVNKTEASTIGCFFGAICIAILFFAVAFGITGGIKLGEKAFAQEPTPITVDYGTGFETPLYAGWNLVTGRNEGTEDYYARHECVDIIWSYDTQNDEWLVWAPEFIGIPDEFFGNAFNTMTNGSYWVHCTF
jgi:hypothetical protein